MATPCSWLSSGGLVVIGRKIVGYFEHLTLAYSHLQDGQIHLGMKPKRLQQDVDTFNCTFYMLETLLEQKCELATYAADYDIRNSQCAPVGIS